MPNPTLAFDPSLLAAAQTSMYVAFNNPKPMPHPHPLQQPREAVLSQTSHIYGAALGTPYPFQAGLLAPAAESFLHTQGPPHGVGRRLANCTKYIGAVSGSTIVPARPTLRDGRDALIFTFRVSRGSVRV